MALGIRIGIPFGNKISWRAYWATLISATVENAAPTDVALTFPTAKPSLGASDFTIAGFTISSASWTGAVLTLVLSTPVIYGDVLVVTFGKTGGTANVTNNVAVIAQYTTVLTAKTTPPSEALKIIENKRLKQLVDGGYFAKAELIDIFFGDTEANSLLNWKSPGTFDPTKIQTPDWVQYEGFTGKKAPDPTSGINLNFIPSVNGTLIAQDSICAIIGIGTDGQTDDATFGTLGTTGSLILWAHRATGGPVVARCNDLTSKNSATTGAKAHHSISRGGATGYMYHRNLVKADIVQASAALTDLGLATCGRWTGAALSANNIHQVRYVLLLSYLTDAEVQAVINIMESWLDDLGTGLFFLNDTLLKEDGHGLKKEDGGFIILE